MRLMRTFRAAKNVAQLLLAVWSSLSTTTINLKLQEYKTVNSTNYLEVITIRELYKTKHLGK